MNDQEREDTVTGKLYRLISETERIAEPFEKAANSNRLSEVGVAEVLIVFYEEQLTSFKKAIASFGGEL